jgi:hypothetical protein
MSIFGPKKDKPRKPDSTTEFVKALDAAIAAARSNGVSARYIAGQMESRAEAMHQQWVLSAPLDRAW